jgi:hypothetical protein
MNIPTKRKIASLAMLRPKIKPPVEVELFLNQPKYNKKKIQVRKMISNNVSATPKGHRMV